VSMFPSPRLTFARVLSLTARRSSRPCHTSCVPPNDWTQESDAAILQRIEEGKLAPHSLEKVLGDYTRAVSIRRQLLRRSSLPVPLASWAVSHRGGAAERSLDDDEVLEDLPYKHFDYSKVFGACAENVIG